MSKRLDLSRKLNEIPGIAAVYFQPPSNTVMKYPCIRYGFSSDHVNHADDLRYLERERYSVTVIDPDPDSTIPDEVKKRFQYCSFDRPYTADNLNHWVFTIFI